MQKFTQINRCRVCGSDKLMEVLDLNEQPLANSYHNGEEEQDFFPLKLNTCTRCFHSQLSVVVNPDLMFKDYLYVSGTSETLDQYFEEFVDMCDEYVGIETPPQRSLRVLDIACNDGTQLDKFKERGWETFGVDPAENLFDLSSRNHEVKCAYWNEEVALSFGHKFDLIVAQNVFAHVDDVHQFLRSCARVLETEGAIVIQTSQANMILDGQFDTIYHEHLSFFSTRSMSVCADQNSFKVYDVKKVAVHGGSYVFVLKFRSLHGTPDNVFWMSLQEDRAGVYREETYKEYALKCKKVVNDFKQKIEEFRDNGFKVIGYGAAAKGNTFLNFANISLDYIVDDNELKQGLLTPGKNIPIVSSDVLRQEDPNKTVVVPLAWNFFEEIKTKVQALSEENFTFIKYFPEMEVVK